MVRAEIYTNYPLHPDIREEVMYGLDLLGSSLGEFVLAKTRIVNLRMNSDGKVTPRQTDYIAESKDVDLQIIAAPLNLRAQQSIGQAHFELGIGYVDTTAENLRYARTTTAHEAAHAFGFVLEGSSQALPNNSRHCSDGNCLLHHNAKLKFDDNYPIEVFRRPRGLKSLLRRSPDVPEDIEDKYYIETQYDFCKPCKSDMSTHGQAQIEVVRQKRRDAEFLLNRGVR